MKKIFLLMPLAFLALTGCSNDNVSSNTETNNNSEQTSEKETSNVESEKTTEEDKTTTPDVPKEIGVCCPVDNKEFYFGFERTENFHQDAWKDKPARDIPAGKYYITGAMDGYYFATSMELANAVKVKTVANGEAWNLKVSDNAAQSAGQYVGVKMSSDGKHINIIYSASAFNWTFNDDTKTFTGDLDGKTIGLGTKKDKGYTTMSAYDAGEHGTDGNYLAHLFGEGGETTPSNPSKPDKPAAGSVAPVNNTQFYFGFERTENFHLDAWKDKPAKDIPAGDYFLTGEMDGFYFKTTTNKSEAASIVTIAKGDAWNLKVSDDAANSAGKYIAVEMSSDGKHINIVYSDTAFDWSYVAGVNSFQGTLDGKTIGLGTQNNKGFTTMSAYDAGEHGTDGNYLAKLYTK